MTCFIIKELTNEFQGQFESFGETKKSTKVLVLIDKEVTKVNKKGNGNVTISYKTKCIDSG